MINLVLIVLSGITYNSGGVSTQILPMPSIEVCQREVLRFQALPGVRVTAHCVVGEP